MTAESMTPYEAIVSKRDLRMYTAEPIADESMARILQAGRMAGSAKNIEANRLIVITDQAVQDALVKAGDFASWIGSSATIIGFASPASELRLFDVGRQAQNMMIAAHDEGIGTCPVTLGHADVARAAVGLPNDWVMPMVITLGYPVEDHPDSPLKRQRVTLDELVRHDRWS
jgi:nitroreductase